MRHLGKRLLAGVLTTVMLVSALPTPAWAALLDNTRDQNAAILRELTEFWGDEKTAQEAMELLRRYNLIDEDGSILTDWSGTITVEEDPRPSNVTELLTMLEDPAADRSMVVTVDGTAITLGDFETMMKIETEIKRIRDTYLRGSVDLTPEQASNLYSLYQQLSENGIQLYSTNGADELVFPSGVDHGVTLRVSAGDSASQNSTYTVTVTPDKAQNNEITFSWRALSGSANATGGGTVTIPAGSTAPVSLSVNVGKPRGKLNGKAAFLVQIYDVKNALINGSNQWGKSITVTGSDTFKYKGESRKTLSSEGNYFVVPGENDTTGGDASAVNAIQEGNPLVEADSDTLFVAGLTEGTYTGTVSFENITFTRIDAKTKYQYLSNNIRWFWTIFTEEKSFKSREENPSPSFQALVGNTEVASSGIPEFLKSESYSYGPYTKTFNGNHNSEYLVKITRSGERAWLHATWLYELYFYPKVSANVKLTMEETTSQTAAAVSAPAGNYYPGQSVPITVKFGFPMKITNSMTLTVNGQTMTPVEAGSTAEYCTFLYTVKKVDESSPRYEKASLNAVGANDKNITVTVNSTDLSNARLVTPLLPDAVDSTPTVNAGQVTYTPAKGDQPEKTTATVTVTLDMPSDTNLRNLIGGSYAVDGGFASSVLAGSIDGGATLVPLMLDNSSNPTRLTATVELDARSLMDRQDFVMEFYTIDETTHESTGLLFGRYAAFSVNKPIPLKAEHLSIQTPAGWPTGPIYANNPPEEAALTLTPVVSAPAGTTWTQTRWVSSDEKVAAIDAGGRVYPLGAGTMEFWLEAVNGNLTEYAGERSQSVSLTIQQGAEPYLRIPEETMTIRSGDPVTVRWASNLVQKNIEYGGASTPTTFTITVTGPDGQQAGEPRTVTYDPADQSDPVLWTDGSPNQSFTIRGLTDTDARGYTVTVSASADAKVPGTQKVFTAQAKVTVVSQPVSVRLTRPASLFQTNTGTLTIPYTLDNYDSKNNAEFRLVVTDNATGLAVTTIETPESDNGGSFPIDLAKAGIQDGFRTIYDVSLQAKNTAEKDWSRDSFTLYIYDKDCLDILVQPVTKNGITTVGVDGDKVTMSNEAWIASLTQDQILALNRDIDLQAAISINYGAHAWGEASDRIRWASENSSVAAVNYPQGAYYENIEGLPYTSFAPATQFLLSGRNDGKTAAEAIHALAGDALSSSVEVTVETLKDKLYLFQFYPVGRAKMTYTNGDGVTKSHDTDANGRAAVYEASGIASDIYVEADIGGEKYLGTVYKNALVSQEKDAVSLELYPLKSLNLRKAASLPVYLKKPDGTNYSGTVTVRAGVYRNGVYCADAKYNTTAGTASFAGDTEHTVTFSNGKATFYYDLTQFNTNNNADPVTAADDIQFVLELRADGYYPVLFTANGTTNEDDAIRLSERIVNLETVPAGQENQPFVARQTVYFSGKESGAAVDVRNQTGKAGPSGDYPDLLLSTTVFWWGQPNDQASRSIQYVDGAGVILTGQEQAEGSYYPFCSMPVSHSTVHLNKTQMDHLRMGDLTIRSLALHYLDADGTAVKKETMRWQMMNALNMPKAGESNDLIDSMDALMEIMQTEGGMSNVGSGFLTVGLKLATSAKIESDFLTLRLAPTQDPTVFRGLVYVGLGTEGEGVSGAGGYEGSLLDTMEPDDESYELNYMPGLDDVKDMISSGLGAYGQSQKNMLTSAKNLLKNNIKQGGLSSVVDKGFGGEFSLSGWFETEVFYDFNARAWKMQLVTGGMKAAGGFGYEWSSNFQVGPVPMFLELGVGMSAAVDFNAAVNNVEKVNDYLTQLEIGAYINAFGGFGFDYAVVALKLGIFGELSLAAQLRWLNAANTSSAQFGHHVTLAGEVGVKAEVTVLFISYSTVLWSAGFEKDLGTSRNWDSIEEYWKEVGAGKSGAGGIITPNGVQLLAYDTASGTALFSAEQEAVLEDRDYLSQYPRSYDSSGPSLDGGISLFSLFTGRTGGQIVKTLENSYSLASPVLSDDGGWLFYLDDGNDAGDATNVRAAVMERNGSNGYDSGSRLDDNGYGDSGLKAAGSGSSAVAVWSRVTERPGITEPGQAITPDVQAAMLNSSDILVAVRGGSGWTVKNLTENNGRADLSPVVAANGSRILVAWRQVASTGATDLSNFDARDYIYYSVSEDDGASWTAPAPVYNGTSGAVKGLEAAMLDSGEAAVVFTLQNGEPSNGAYHQEIAYAIVDKSGGSYDVARYVQVTDDDNLDENPQVAAVKLDDNTSAFVLGWHCLSGDGSDIRLAAIDGSGSRITGFVDSLNSMIQNTGVSVSPNFQFAKNAEKLEDLSILWTETDADAGESGSAPSHDCLSALRFRVADGKISVTSAQRLVEMEDYTAIDSFNAYAGNGGNLYAAMQGTYYDYSNPESVQVGGTTVQVAGDKTSIYTTVGAYTDTLRVDSVIPDYANIRKGTALPVQVSVTNLGTQPLTEVEVKIGDTAATFQEGTGSAFVAIAPGDTRILTVFYTVPSAGNIPNPKYTVTGTFQGGGTDASEEEALILNIPDLGIADSDILVDAVDGTRILQFNLYNLSDAALAGSGRTVQFNLYSDAACTNAIDQKYLTLVQSGPGRNSGALLTVSGNDLAAIDEGSYTLQYKFDLETYIKDGSEFADHAGEVRDGGVTVYAKAWVELPGQDGGEMLEYNSSNNAASIHFESLLKQAEGTPTTVTHTLDNSGEGSKVTVTLQNNSMTQKTTGNVIFILLDADGTVLEQKQSYTGGQDRGLITLDVEERKTLGEVTFSHKGTDVQVLYTDAKLADDANTNIAALSLHGVPLSYDEAEKTWSNTGTFSTPASSLLSVVPEDPRAAVTVTVNGKTQDVPVQLPLQEGDTTVTVTVTAANGTTGTYELKLSKPVSVTGGGSGGSRGSGGYAVTVTKPEHGRVTASPSNASVGSTVTLTVTPDSGYVLDTLTVTDSRGSEIKLTARDGGKYTFTMPGRAVTVKVAFTPLPGDAKTPCDGGADCPSRAYTDLSTAAWYHEAVDYVLNNGIMGGYGNGLFGPNNHLSRAQLAQILYNREGRPSVTAGSPFTDVAENAWCADAVTWASVNGIVGGYGNGTFGPNNPITREQLAVMLWRYAGSPAATRRELHFSDVGAGSEWAMEALLWANENGVMNGDGNGHLNPKGAATRAHVAQMIKNFISSLEKKP